MHTRQLRLLLGEAPLQCLHEVDHIALRLGGGSLAVRASVVTS